MQSYFHDIFRQEFRWIYDNADCYEEKRVSYQTYMAHATQFYQRKSRPSEASQTARRGPCQARCGGLAQCATAIYDLKIRLTNLRADLGGHHDIEETYIFPYLAQRMPEFKQESGEHVQQRTSLAKIPVPTIVG